jgi:predicted dehydrogenase
MAPTEKLRLFDTASVNGNGVHPAGRAPERKLRLPDEQIHIPAIPAVEPLAAQLTHFVECCRQGLMPESDGRTGTNVVRVLEAAEISLADGGRRIDVAADLAALA